MGELYKNKDVQISALIIIIILLIVAYITHTLCIINDCMIHRVDHKEISMN